MASRSILSAFGLGFVVAAAGIGGSDVSMGGLAGSKYGLALAWCVALGALLKFGLNEGIARWQLVTGQTLLEGVCARLGWAGRAVFLIYIVPWTFFVGASLISACGLTAATLAPRLVGWVGASSPERAMLPLGLVHSAACAALVLLGGFRVFKRVMSVLAGFMVVTMVIAAVLMAPDAGELAKGLLVPRIPSEDPQAGQWALGLIGAVGGTVTMLAYGYLLREQRISGPEHIRACRVDLAAGYAMTALFGISLMVISAGAPVKASGADLFAVIADRLASTVHPAARWLYLTGVWCAVTACMLGVWHSASALFTDWWEGVAARPGRDGADARQSRARAGDGEASRSPVFRVYMSLLATLPALALRMDFSRIQKINGLVGAAFAVLLGAALLIMNNRRAWLGEHRYGAVANIAVAAAVLVTGAGLCNEVLKLVGWGAGGQ